MANARQSFEGRAFHPDLGNEAVEGMVWFSSLSLHFEGAEIAVEIPLNHLLAEIEEGAEPRVVFRDSGQPDWTITTADLGVLEMRTVPQLLRLTEQFTSRLVRREITRRVKIAVGFFAACGLILWLGMLATGAMVRSIVAKVPPDVERQYGQALLDELKGEVELSDDTNEIARLAKLVEPLLAALPAGQQWQFHIAEEDEPNAFALPGGHITVTRGLLKLSERPEHLLGVVAHEVAHVTLKHGFRDTVSSAGPFLVFRVFMQGRGGALGILAGGSALLVNQSFSQEYEKEADDQGWEYLVKANIDPRGMIEMFRNFKTHEAAEKHESALPKAFDSHPDLDKRIARLEKKWKGLQRKSGFIVLNDESQSEH